MGKLTAFHKTVQGYNHVKAGTPCEDFSDSYQDEAGRFCIGAVADGHGDEACFRSSFGSKTAATIAVECLKELGNAYFQEDTSTSMPIKEQLGYERGRRILLRQLTDRIISAWSRTVLADLEANPPTEEELSGSGRMENVYRSGERLEHIFGTTLIAALWLPEYLILLHQGDGRCDVFFDDGRVEQPIPWDSRCYENVTTSLCDPDSADAIRTCVIDLKSKHVVACYLGSDGVEDYYPNADETQEGTHCFYRKLSVAVSKLDPDSEAVETMMEPLLENHTREGNGDDVSVAGIYMKDELERLAVQMDKDVKMFEDNDTRQRQLLAYEQKIGSMQRKHGILQRKFSEAQADADRCNQSVQVCQGRIVRLSQELEDLRNQQASAFAEMQEESEEAGKARDYLDEQEQSDSFRALLRYAAEGFGLFRTRIEDAFQSKAKAYEALSGKVSAKAAELETEEQELSQYKAALEEAQSHLQQAQEAFEEYDAEYQRLCAERDNLLTTSSEEQS